VRQLIRRFCSCEGGAGLVEYGIILGLLTLGLIGVMHVYRRAVGDMTNRTAVTISKQSAAGYSARPAPRGGSAGGGSAAGSEPPAPPPDSASAGESPPCPGGSTTCTLAGHKTAH
jgi:Flp pilus assembly pilin Flp